MTHHQYTVLRYTNLSYANLSYVDMSEAWIDNTNLRYVDLSTTKIYHNEFLLEFMPHTDLFCTVMIGQDKTKERYGKTGKFDQCINTINQLHSLLSNGYLLLGKGDSEQKVVFDAQQLNHYNKIARRIYKDIAQRIHNKEEDKDSTRNPLQKSKDYNAADMIILQKFFDDPLYTFLAALTKPSNELPATRAAANPIFDRNVLRHVIEFSGESLVGEKTERKSFENKLDAERKMGSTSNCCQIQ